MVFLQLFPQPQKITYLDEKIISHKIKSITCFDDALKEKALVILAKHFDEDGLTLIIEEDHNIAHSEGYSLTLNKTQVLIKAQKAVGAFYALNTLCDILESSNEKTLIIEDYPLLEIRGVMLDISRSKVPTLETLKQLVRMFAKLRYNHLELYIEGFAFEYQHFKPLLKAKNYISLKDYLALEKYAKEYYIDFVPNQNGFGHMSDWLALDEYQMLAECPDGFTIWGAHRMPSTLNPLDERSTMLVKKMYRDMIPHTSSKYFNMNFDEPYELGSGKSQEATLQSSVEDVYIDYFNKLYEDVKSYNKIPMLWGDVLVKHPEKIDKLPSDVIFIDWGYDKEYPFFEHAKMLASKKVKYMLAPGTSSWATITGRILDMQTTIENSTQAAKQYQALGVLVTDWGDVGHLQYLPISYLGFIYGGLLSWSKATFNDAITYLKKILNDDALCEAILELGKYHLLEGPYRGYGSRLFSAITYAEHARRQQNKLAYYQEKVCDNLIDEKHHQLLQISFAKAEALLKIANDSLETRELKNSLLLLKTLESLNQKFSLIREKKRIDFKNEIIKLKKYAKMHKKLWNARNNPHGYAQSVNRIIWLIEILEQLMGKENLQ